MIGKKGFITALAIVAALAIPTVGMAGNGPLSADSQPLVAPGETETDEPYGWMDEMHDSMWGAGPGAGPYGWMDEMHDSMWGAGSGAGPYGWMDEMHDSMWSGGQLPEGSPAGPCPMGAASWGGR